MKHLAVLSLFAVCAAAQTVVPVPAPVPDAKTAAGIAALSSITLPTYIAAGGAYNQFAGWNAWASAIIPVSTILPSVKSDTMYESTTADIFPIKSVINGKSGYLLTTSIREGMHRAVIKTPRFTGLVGGDIGYAFTQSATPPATPAALSSTVVIPTSGISASITATGVWHITKSLSAMVPVRFLYMANAGGWNAIVEVGLVFTPGTK